MKILGNEKYRNAMLVFTMPPEHRHIQSVKLGEKTKELVSRFFSDEMRKAWKKAHLPYDIKTWNEDRFLGFGPREWDRSIVTIFLESGAEENRYREGITITRKDAGIPTFGALESVFSPEDELEGNRFLIAKKWLLQKD